MKKETESYGKARKELCSLDIPWWVGAPAGGSRRKRRAAKAARPASEGK